MTGVAGLGYTWMDGVKEKSFAEHRGTWCIQSSAGKVPGKSEVEPLRRLHDW